MLTLEQVKSLEAKVERAVQVINGLRMENKQLRASLQSANRRVAELEGSLQKVEQEQGRIEEGFKGALRKLDELEDLLSPVSGIDAESNRKATAPAAPGDAATAQRNVASAPGDVATAQRNVANAPGSPAAAQRTQPEENAESGAPKALTGEDFPELLSADESSDDSEQLF